MKNENENENGNENENENEKWWIIIIIKRSIFTLIS